MNRQIKPEVIQMLGIDDYLEPKPRNKYPKGLNAKYKQYLMSSTSKGITLEYSEEEFITFISNNCHYCGLPNAQGIDKINSKGHYTKDNCVPCCKMCNTMKFIYSTEVFIEHVERIYKHNAIKSV